MTSQAPGNGPRGIGSRPAGNGFAAVIFDLDGVVANATDLHVAAWGSLFDATLPVLAPAGTVAPFTIDDYRAHVEGRSHEDAARAVLAFRDLAPVEGRPGDGPDALTIRGLATEGVREALCTLANGYWGTRGAAAPATADAVHYPGTYLAGVYNRVDGDVDERTVQRESIVNGPNWLLLTIHHVDGTPIDADHGTPEGYRQELDLRRGVLTRTFVHHDPTGRRTRITERRLVCLAERHLAALERRPSSR